MDRASHRLRLCPGFSDPLSRSGGVRSCGAPTGTSGDPMKDRAVERRVDDLVVGHVCPSLNTPNLKQPVSVAYRAKTEIVQ